MINQSVYIMQVEGKDIINANYNYKTKKNKKFKATLDYCQDVIKLLEINPDAIYTDDNKFYTKAIVSLTFEYSVKEFNPCYINKNKVYLKYNQNVKNLTFVNGVAIDDLVGYDHGGARVQDALLKPTQEQDEQYNVLGVIVDQFINISDGELLDIIKDELLEINGFTFLINEKNQIKWEVDTDKLDIVLTTDQIRENLYINGFKIDGVDYCRYKRSSGSAREGRTLTIRKDLYTPMMDWSMMGLKFPGDKPCDLAAIEAYISLTLSSIIGTVSIKPDQILVIKDYESIFNDKVYDTKLVDGKFVTNINDNAEIKNNIWDGQSLLDKSFYSGEYADKSMLLLRNRFFKSACFATDIQLFFTDNDITNVSQLNGFTLAKDINDIKLITTPSSIKYTKYSTIQDYLNRIDNTYGIVKTEKPTPFFDGDLVQSHYQLLNTVKLSYDQVVEVIKPSIDYIGLLKKDINVFRHHLKLKIKDNLKMGDINKTDEMIFTMLQVNNEFIDTDLFKGFRQDTIDSYVNNIKHGHILLPGNYSVLFSNGLEMLKAAIGQFDGKSSIGIDQVICNQNKFPVGSKLIGCRSPHITMGNLWLCEVVENVDINRYFGGENGLSKEVVYIDSIGNNILQKLNGADFDSDAVALINHPLLYNAIKENYNRFLVPTHNIKPEPIERYNTLKDKAKLDISCSNDLIGRIVNLSQLCNSILWQTVNNGEDINSKLIDNIYTDICTLAIMSNLAIDSAKKEFPVDLEKELEYMAEKYRKRDKKTNKTEKPAFFKVINYSKKHGKTYSKSYSFKEMNTTMDYLQMAVKEGMKETRKKNERGKNKLGITLMKLINKNNGILIYKADRQQIKRFIIPTIYQFREQSKKIWSNENKESEEKYKEHVKLKLKMFQEIGSKYIAIETIKKILVDVGNGKYAGYERLILTTLYAVKKDVFMSLFIANREPISILKRSKNELYDVNLYGINYNICTHKACNS